MEYIPPTTSTSGSADFLIKSADWLISADFVLSAVCRSDRKSSKSFLVESADLTSVEGEGLKSSKRLGELDCGAGLGSLEGSAEKSSR